MVVNAAITLTFGATARPLVSPGGATATERFDLIGLATIAVAVAVVTVTALLVFGRTNYGFAIRAVSENASGVELLGVPLDRLVGGVFFSSGMLAAAAGVYLALRNGLTPQMGYRYGIWAFAVVIVAGFGSVGGILAVGVATGVIVSLTIGWFGAGSYVDVVLFGIMTASLLFRPYGMWGRQLRRF